jgi:hypothetical protein
MKNKPGVVSVALALLMLLASCSREQQRAIAPAEPQEAFADLTGEKIHALVVEDMSQLRSVRLAGNRTQVGRKVALDIVLNTQSVCTGLIRVGKGRAQIISGPEGQFLNGDADFWSFALGGDAAARRVMTGLRGDGWTKMATGETTLTEVCDLDYLAGKFVSAEPGLAWVAGDQATIGGVKTLELTSAGAKPATTMWVSIEDPHYIVRFSDAGGTITMSGFDVDVVAEPPKDEDIVDFAQLGVERSG